MKNSNFCCKWKPVFELFSEGREISKYCVWCFRQCHILYCSVFRSTVGSSLSYLLPIPKSISVANPSIDILDLETSWPALTWQSLTLWLSLGTLSPFTSPHEILLGEILWLSLDLPYWLRREVRWHVGKEEMLNRETSAEFCWCHRFLPIRPGVPSVPLTLLCGHRCWVLLLVLGLVPSETCFCSKALCGLSSIQHCKTVVWGCVLDVWVLKMSAAHISS